MAVIIVENAKKMGLICHTFSNKMTDKAVGITDYHHNVSIYEINKIVSVCVKFTVIGVLPTTELTISVAALVSQSLGLHGMPVEISKMITDKGFVRNCAINVPQMLQPKYLIWNKGDNIPIIEEYPVIVKPTSMGGKRGVIVVNSQDKLKDAIYYALSSMPSYKNSLIIEEYLNDGTELSVESISYEGNHKVIQVTEKISSGPPHCVELGHIQPARINKIIRKQIEEIIPIFLKVVGVDNSTSHTEIKVINNKIYLIELNARSGGDHISHPLTELSTGYPYVQGAINVAIGNYVYPHVNVDENRFSGVIFVANQTKQFVELFRDCDKYPWLYKKHIATKDLVEIKHNNCFDTNYFIFCSDNNIPIEIEKLIKNE